MQNKKVTIAVKKTNVNKRLVLTIAMFGTAVNFQLLQHYVIVGKKIFLQNFPGKLNISALTQKKLSVIRVHHP